MTKKLIRAIKASIRHWERDIVKPLEEGREIDKFLWGGLWWEKTTKQVPCTIDSCALCRIFFFNDCIDCPLESCGENSTYEKFYENPCLKTARAMVRKLKSLLPKEEA